MADISISLNSVQNTKTVNIEGVGIVRVRRLGSGEELDLSAKMRRLGKIINELSSMDFTKFKSDTPEGIKIVAKLTKRANEISEEIEEIKKFEYNIYKRCFSDDEDGRVVDVIMNTLTEEERVELFKQIFDPRRTVETTDPIIAQETKDE